ncbi:MAG: LysR substrate-binding domain-containing protein [Sphingorhabdus sp.]
MRYRLPSLKALRALEAAGRRGSLSAAAKELGVSVGAISRYVTLLEGYFGRTLLRRQSSGVVPTADCATYLESVAKAFDEIDSASHRLATNRERDNSLRLRFYSTFTTEWLSARLADFQARHPEIHLEFDLSIKDAEWRDDDFDMALTGRPPTGEEFRCDRLFETYLALVCSPKLIAGQPWAGPDRLLSETVLMSPRETELWSAVLDDLALPSMADLQCIRFDSLSMTYQAARQGAGVALGNLFLIADDLGTGRLTLPVEQIFDVSLPHYLVTRRSRRDGPALAAFRTWLLNAARETEAKLTDVRGKHIFMPIATSMGIPSVP